MSSRKILHFRVFYGGRSEMIWAELIYNTFITFRIYCKDLLAQHILLLGYTPLPSLWVRPDSFTGPFLRGVGIPLMDSRPCSFLSTVESQHAAERISGAFSPQIADNRR